MLNCTGKNYTCGEVNDVGLWKCVCDRYAMNMSLSCTFLGAHVSFCVVQELDRGQSETEEQYPNVHRG